MSRVPEKGKDRGVGESGTPRVWLHLATFWIPYFIVFVASACSLIIEIVAVRMLAPEIGVSLYTWTSIIGVVLAGISVGNYVGGRVADRFPSPTTLGLILLSGGISSLGILALVSPVSSLFNSMSIVPRIVFMTTTLFFLPSLILGMVSPMVIKIRLRDLANTGNVVGTVYAISTAGSILGTFLTGFLLIQLMGTRMVLVSVAVVLLVMALAFGNLWRPQRSGLALIALFVLLGVINLAAGNLDSDCLEESNYYCITIIDTVSADGRPAKSLVLDNLQHSFVSVDDPTLLDEDYQLVFADVKPSWLNGIPAHGFYTLEGRLHRA